jgi:hypothetical protein
LWNFGSIDFLDDGGPPFPRRIRMHDDGPVQRGDFSEKKEDI